MTIAGSLDAEYVSDVDFNDDVGDIDNTVVTVQCVDNLIAPFGCCTIYAIWLLYHLHHLAAVPFAPFVCCTICTICLLYHLHHLAAAQFA